MTDFSKLVFALAFALLVSTGRYILQRLARKKDDNQ